MYFMINARSLPPKIDELHALVTVEQPQVICIVESWLADDIADNEISIVGYQVFRLDRNRQGGGVLTYVHDSIVPTTCTILSAAFNL